MCNEGSSFEKAMSRMGVAGAIFLAITVPAFAEWKVESSQDKLTKKDVKIAWVEATDHDSGSQGRLEIFCNDDELAGGLAVRLHTSVRLSPDWMGFSYRIDDGSLKTLHMQASGGEMSNWGDARAILKGKRIRVRLEPFNAPAMLFDFDGSGADVVERAISCRQART